MSSSELVVVPGEVFSVVGGLASHKHVPVVQDLLSGQQLILQMGKKGTFKITQKKKKILL